MTDVKDLLKDLDDKIAALINARQGLVFLSKLAPVPILGTGQKKPARRSTLSAKGKKAIAEAQRKRWAEQKRKQRRAAKKTTPPA